MAETTTIARLKDTKGEIQEFDLATLDKTGADTAYALFTPEQQARADALAKLVLTVKAPVPEIPQELLEPEGARKLMAALSDKSAKTYEDVAGVVRSLYKDLAPAEVDKLAKSLVSIAQGAATAASVTGTVVSAPFAIAGEVYDWYAVAPRALNQYLKNQAIAADSAGDKPTPEKAAILARAYVLKEASLTVGPDASEETRQREPNLGDKAGAVVELTWRSAAIYGVAIFNFAMAGFKNWDGAKQEAETFLGFQHQGYSELLEENIKGDAQEAAAPQVAATFDGIETIAGLKTAPLLAMMHDEEGKYAGFEGFDGKLYSFDKTNLTSKTLEGVDGKPLTRDALDKYLGDEAEASHEDPIMGSIGQNGPLIGTAAGLSTLASARGIAQGAARAHATTATNTLTKKAASAAGDVTDLQERINKSMQGTKPHFWSRSVENLGTLTDDLKEAASKAADLDAKVKTMPADPIKAMKAAPDKLSRAVGGLAEAAEAPIKPLKLLGRSEVGLLEKTLHLPTAIGRAVGYGVASVVDAPLRMVGRSVATDLDTGKKMLQWATTGGPADVPGNLYRGLGFERVAKFFSNNGKAVDEANGVAKSADIAADVAKPAVEVAEKTSHLTGLLRIGGKFAKALPVVGVVGTVGGLFWASAAQAETVNGDKLTGVEQLKRDLALGRINRTEYEAYRGIQVAYGASGLLGFVGGGVVEAVQAGAEHMDVSKIGRYLPPSLVKEVSSMIRNEQSDGALGKADEGITLAATETKQNAQKAAKPMVAHSVKLGAVKTEGDSAPKPNAPMFARFGIDIPGIDFV